MRFPTFNKGLTPVGSIGGGTSSADGARALVSISGTGATAVSNLQSMLELNGDCGSADTDSTGTFVGFSSNMDIPHDSLNVSHFFQDQANNSDTHGGREVGFRSGGKMTGGSVFAYAAFADNQGFNGDHFIHQSGTDDSNFGGTLKAAGLAVHNNTATSVGS